MVAIFYFKALVHRVSLVSVYNQVSLHGKKKGGGGVRTIHPAASGSSLSKLYM